MSKYASMSPAKRIETGKALAVMGIQYGLYLAASIALTIATGYYLWEKETDNECRAYNQKDQFQAMMDGEEVIKVHERFDIILKIYFAVFVTEVVRSVIMLMAVVLKSTKLAQLYQLGCLNDCLALAALVILHVYRFQPSGKACTGDYLREDHDATEDQLTELADSPLGKAVLIYRGRFLLGLVIWVWVGGVGLCCLTCILSALALKS